MLNDVGGHGGGEKDDRARQRLYSQAVWYVMIVAYPFMADTVAKVENQTSLKISQKPMFRRLAAAAMTARADTKVRGSFLGKTMWSPHIAARRTHQRS